MALYPYCVKSLTTHNTNVVHGQRLPIRPVTHTTGISVPGMKDLSDIADFRDSYCNLIPQHGPGILICGANTAAPSAYAKPIP